MSGHSKRGNVLPTGMFPWIFHGDIFQYRDESRKTYPMYELSSKNEIIDIMQQDLQRKNPYSREFHNIHVYLIQKSTPLVFYV